MHDEVAELKRRNAALEAEVRLLRQKMDLLLRRFFGKKSETLNPDQLQLLFGSLEEDEPEDPLASAAEPPAEVEGPPQKARPRRPRLPEHLPVEEQIIEPDAVMACPEAWRRIGEEVSEQLDYEPGRFLRRRLIRPKYVKRANAELPPVIAPLPERLIERGLYAPGLLAHIAVSKYADHLPLYRQEQIYRQRYAVELPRQSLARAMGQVADWLRPVVREMSRQQFAGSYVQIDETPIRYLQPGTGKAPQGYLWVAHVPGGDSIYHWYASRSHECLLDFVPTDFAGVVQCDGYRAYRTFAEKREHVELAGCWAHVRRKFYEAWQQGEAPADSAWVIERIGQLYRMERHLRESRAGPAERRTRRQQAARPILAELHQTLSRYKAERRHLPQSLMGKAVDYAIRLWPDLEVWLDRGDVEIDNNLIENRIRPTALGKKNWLFLGADCAGWRSAVLFSVVTSCRNHGIDPHAYLKEVLERLPSMTNHQIPEITPAAWAKARSQDLLKAS